ncbi:hypothetical protein A1O7_08121 [Cladophialophora yegresii CBS 114405]|uniref:DNA-directed RNA polymerase III subunit RPC5 n=1 Tax=Cladophialophora yegresii CBS 114405 TaxID=1182544 RepID=W9VQ97_9EURO|nr:uncharacterized protein A1O7_08121 [Cladophialophora yegresii CBS 114405]EXJ55195.1 hypothetical protein A1O7_08121 [Cladophialophora yegresii CBS 114405]
MADEDDPVVASYDVCLSSNVFSGDAGSSNLYLLQYPSHRPRSKPYNAARSQAPTFLRLKPEAGFVEVDVPILKHEHYNENQGQRFGKAMADSRTLQAGGSYGLAGGFGTGSVQPRVRDVPMHDQINAPVPALDTQTLGGKITKPTARDPIYLIGYVHQNKIQLSHLDAIVQMRPQLHHIDAEEELNQKRAQGGANAGASRQKPGMEPPAPKVESKAIEIKIKDNKDDMKDRTMKDNARQLRDILVDPWQNHEWVDEDEEEARTALRASLGSADSVPLPKLRSALGNGDWLEKMSAPREEGKKGLLSKLRGRERERARRKKAEEEKRQRQREAAGNAPESSGPFLDMSDDSELSSPEITDDDLADEVAASEMKATEEVQVKEEPAPFPATKRSLLASAPIPKKRGRPRKNPAAE